MGGLVTRRQTFNNVSKHHDLPIHGEMLHGVACTGRGLKVELDDDAAMMDDIDNKKVYRYAALLRLHICPNILMIVLRKSSNAS